VSGDGIRSSGISFNDFLDFFGMLTDPANSPNVGLLNSSVDNVAGGDFGDTVTITGT